jgi:hypothetical protein
MSHAAPATSEAGSEASRGQSTVWRRPSMLGYAESLRGLGGIVAPLLTGFSLAAIATLASADNPPPLADWASAALAGAVALLLFSMQVAFLALTRNSTPGDVLMWHPEATVSEELLEEARRVHAADFAEMTRLGRLSLGTYGAGLLAFLVGVVLLMVPNDWTIAWSIGLVATGAALALETWWMLAYAFPGKVRHPVSRRGELTHRAEWGDKPPALNAVGLAAVLDGARRSAARLPDLGE